MGVKAMQKQKSRGERNADWIESSVVSLAVLRRECRFASPTRNAC